MTAFVVTTDTNVVIKEAFSGTGPISFTFEGQDQDDIKVYINGTETTAFSLKLNIVEGGYDGGSVTLNAAVTNARVVVARETQRLRRTSFGIGGAAARDVDDELNRIIMITQDQARDIARAFKVDYGDTESEALANINTVATDLDLGASSLIRQAVDGIVAPAIKTGVYNARDTGFGIVGDGNAAGGGTDDTTAIQDAINGLERAEVLVFDRDKTTGRFAFNVSEVVIDSALSASIYNTIRFENGALLYGVATTAKDSIIKFKGASRQLWENLTIETDGTASAPLYHNNYQCGVRFESQFAGVDGYTADVPTQFLELVGGQMRNIKRAMVFGAPDGSAAQARSTMSEIGITRMGFRGVEQCILMNAENAYVEFIGCRIMSQQFEANSSWYDDNTGFLIKALEGHVLTTGGQLQKASQDGHSLWVGSGDSAGISINGTMCEWSAPSHLEGDCEILDPFSGFYGPNTDTCFEVPANAKGRFKFRGRWEKNIDGDGGGAGFFLRADAAPDYEYSIDADLVDFKWDNQFPLVLGGKPDIRRIAIKDHDPTTTPVEFIVQPNGAAWASYGGPISRDGTGESTTLSAATKGGWDPLTNMDLASYTEDGRQCWQFRASGNGSSARSNQFALTGGFRIGPKPALLVFEVKVLATTDVWRIKVDNRDTAGAQIGSDVEIVSETAATSAARGTDVRFVKYAVPIPAQVGRDACFLKVEGPIGSANMRIALIFEDIYY